MSVQLLGGNGQYEGRVQVSFNDITGTICDDLFDDMDAKVVCRMMGYRSAYTKPHYKKRKTSESMPTDTLCNIVKV